jgi:hypothetical protein
VERQRGQYRGGETEKRGRDRVGETEGKDIGGETYKRWIVRDRGEQKA